jgi:hypothetical protein
MSTDRTARKAAYYQANRASIKTTQDAWKAGHPELVKGYRRKSNAARPDRHLVEKYGLSGEEYARQLAAQGGVCAICRHPETVIDNQTGRPRALSVDHDHASGVFRGLLCGRCNRAIGLLGDDPELVAAAAEYLAAAPRLRAVV